MRLSLEFFPPKNEHMEDVLWQAIEEFKILKPEFVSVTYGAGGTTRDKTYETVIKIQKDTELSPASHLTCIGSTQDELKEIAKNYWSAGIRHIVALRGDLPDGYNLPDGSCSYAWQLVELLKKVHDFEISVAGYPEKHPEASSMEADIDNVKRKVDAGATRIITQFCFSNIKYIEYLNLLQRKQIKASVVPGILPITNFQQMSKFASKCAAAIPSELEEAFNNAGDNEEANFKVAQDFASNQCRFLQDHGINEFHFYTLNRSQLTLAVLKDLGILV